MLKLLVESIPMMDLLPMVGPIPMVNPIAMMDPIPIGLLVLGFPPLPTHQELP